MIGKMAIAQNGIGFPGRCFQAFPAAHCNCFCGGIGEFIETLISTSGSN